MRTLVLAAVLAALLAGCNYEQVYIISGHDVYQGTILSDWRLVKVEGPKVVMSPGARLAIRTLSITQTLAQLDMRIVEGDGLAAYVRTTPHDGTERAMALYYRTDGSSVRTDDGELLPVRINAESTDQTLRFYNEGALAWFAVGCDRVWEQMTDRPATEFLILETLPGTTVEISGIRFDATDEE